MYFGFTPGWRQRRREGGGGEGSGGVSEKLSENQRPREREGRCASCGQMRVAELCCGVEKVSGLSALGGALER